MPARTPEVETHYRTMWQMNAITFPEITPIAETCALIMILLHEHEGGLTTHSLYQKVLAETGSADWLEIKEICLSLTEGKALTSEPSTSWIALDAGQDVTETQDLAPDTLHKLVPPEGGWGVKSSKPRLPTPSPELENA